MQRPNTHAPRAGCSLCTIITNLRSAAGSSTSNSNQSTSVDVDRSYRTPWNSTLSPDPNHSPTSQDPRSPTSPSAQAPLTSSSTSTSPTRSGSVDDRHAIYTDEDLTVWPAKSTAGEALASGERHLVLAFNAHVESVYEFGRADVPLLLRAQRIANDLLDKDPAGRGGAKGEDRKIGFVVGPLRDPKHPYAHIHLHAVKGRWDLASYYRKAMVYNFVGWYELEDLIAEIREGSSNNRVKSGYEHHGAQPPPSSSLRSAGSPEPSPRTPTMHNRGDFLSPPIPTNPRSAKGKQRETFPPNEKEDDRERTVKDIDAMIERVKSDQAASEQEWRAARPGVDDKAAMA